MSYYRATPAPSNVMIYLGESKTGNIRTLAPDIDYTSLTSNNFVVVPKNNIAYREWSAGIDWEHHGGSDFTVYVSATATYNVSKSYNSNTGEFSCNISTSAGDTGVKIYCYKEN